MIYSSWREVARPIIARVLAETKGQDEKAIKRALVKAYPFDERLNHPYKIWRDEIAVQRGKKLPPEKRSAAAIKAKKLGTGNPRLAFEQTEAAKGRLAL